MSFRFEAQNDPSSLSPVCDIAPACTTLQDETPVHQPRAVHFVLGFSHLTYSVKARRRVVLPGFSKKTILDDISGEARDGEIMAVMGASGSGKSTLIDALANRMAKGSVKGSITLNGEQLESRLLKVISAYVMQDDLLFPMLTVEETLMFAAEFRLPRTLSNSEKKQRVQALIDQLGLRHAANTVIGDEDHRGISGGERRRVSIGTVIIPDPIMLFLDEPTTGLDSTSAFMVVQVLQRIAQSGSIVIMSIHQPSSRIMGLLDRMIFLSRGKTVFHGAPSDLPLYLSELGQPIPDNENRTELALDLIGELEVEFNKSWHQSNPAAAAAAENVSNSSLKEAICGSISRGKLISGATPFANPPWIELAVLSRRSFTNSRRMPKLLRSRVTTVVVTGFILATVFWRLDNSRKGAQDHLGFFAFAMATTIYFCTDGMPVFLQERYIVTREMACNAYRRSSYVLSHSLVSIPALVFLSLAFAAITFWAVGLDGSFLFYFFIIFASFWVGSSFISFLSGVVPHLLLGYMIVAAMLNYFRLFSGFFITRGRIPPYWIWFHYISPLKYSYQAVVQNEFRDPAKCFVRGVQIFDGTPLAAVAESMKVELLESMKIDNATCITTAADILRHRSFDDLSKWDCLWLMLAWGVFFRILFLVCLIVGGKNKR